MNRRQILSSESAKNRKIRALVLAGSRGASDAVAEAGGKSAKAFVEVKGIPMIERVIATLLETGRCDEIHISLPDHLPVQDESPRLFEWLQAGSVKAIDTDSSPARSVLRAFPDRDDDALLLVTTCDHPLLSPAMVHELLDAFDSGADVAAGIVSTDAIRHRYPGIRRTAIRFRDGAVTGCNLFAFRGEAGVSVVRFWTRMEARRKRPLRMAWALGMGTTILYALGLLTLDAALARLGRRLRAQLRAVRLADVHAGIDVDTPEDLRMVRNIIEGRE